MDKPAATGNGFTTNSQKMNSISSRNIARLRIYILEFGLNIYFQAAVATVAAVAAAAASGLTASFAPTLN
jgi:hypothetical protein